MNDQNSKMFRMKEVNTVLQREMDRVIQENIDKNISTKTDLDHYYWNINPESVENYPKMYRIDQLNLKLK